MSTTQRISLLGQAAKNLPTEQTKNLKMNNKEINYEAPELEIVEMVLENGIAFTIVHDTYEFEDLEEGGDLGTY